MSQPSLKFSMMSTATNMSGADYFVILQNGANKISSLSTVLSNLNSLSNIRVNPNNAAIDFSVGSSADSNSFFVDGSSGKIGVGLNAPNSKFHIAGNLQVGGNAAGINNDGIISQSSETLTYTSDDGTTVKPMSPLRSGSVLNCNAGVNGLWSLNSGVNGQIKTITVNQLDVGKTAKISLTLANNMNTITFSAIGDSVILQYFSDQAKWFVLASNGATVSYVA